METRVQQLEQEVRELKDFINSLKSSNSIPFEVDGAFRKRFLEIAKLTVSTKSASSENKAVNEAGSSSYSVLNVPDGFLQQTISGVIKYIPYYD